MSHEKPESPEPKATVPADAPAAAEPPQPDSGKPAESSRVRLIKVTGNAGRSITIIGTDLD